MAIIEENNKKNWNPTLSMKQKIQKMLDIFFITLYLNVLINHYFEGSQL